MCLGIPGKILSIYEDHGTKMAKIDFGGVSQEACIEVIPDAKPGDWTIVHAGFALNKLSEEEAQETLDMLREMSELAEAEDNKQNDG
ncbi:MAG: HypC/HybG/HupF family hydrogenase formation chaperone [Chloroflexota bacterium]|jgi:hydrogenase expression/formation protein HypC|nr:HypC/HybG/HupF family hydrogenase formation chaperone [Chloroflexota bacterium]